MQRTVICFVVISLISSLIQAQNSRPYVNPSILQDSRNLPQTDGTFGFLYRTEDGIAHAAVGNPSGQVQGRFTYTDPTGLKVNYNYNTGSVAGRREQSQPSATNNQRVAQPQQEEFADYEEYSAPKQQNYARSRPRQSSYADV
ncbi:hypothetical protein RN001_004987 [Aquatica leii]|uniref:Uncharacterized protein n=1 Tax=Aquatica leii TaxID=1421715 RepID=A0AAN7SPQ5_9COLE|nr:hypothetical protein RN001_004987 [Aquatica leii]